MILHIGSIQVDIFSCENKAVWKPALEGLMVVQNIPCDAQMNIIYLSLLSVLIFLKFFITSCQDISVVGDIIQNRCVQ